MSVIDIDYKNNQFEYPELTRIIGEPTTSSLIVILKEVWANASSVQSALAMNMLKLPGFSERWLRCRTSFATADCNSSGTKISSGAQNTGYQQTHPHNTCNLGTSILHLWRCHPPRSEGINPTRGISCFMNSLKKMLKYHLRTWRTGTYVHYICMERFYLLYFLFLPLST